MGRLRAQKEKQFGSCISRIVWYYLTMEYIDSNGDPWTISLDPKPIPTAALDIDYCHEDYDGAPDAHDHRCGNAGSIAEAKAIIEEIAADYA